MEPGPRSWRRAFDDLRGGWRQRPLWGYLGWQDIKQRYRRSVLGPLWISITMGVIATAMGILYGALFHEPIQTFLPYVATGLLIWNFINGCILEGSEVFIANEGLIRFLPAPLTLHVYRLVWRQTLFFLHNLVVWALADNERARHFYRRHGFQADGVERYDDIGGASLLEVRYRRG